MRIRTPAMSATIGDMWAMVRCIRISWAGTSQQTKLAAGSVRGEGRGLYSRICMGYEDRMARDARAVACKRCTRRLQDEHEMDRPGRGGGRWPRRRAGRGADLPGAADPDRGGI